MSAPLVAFDVAEERPHLPPLRLLRKAMQLEGERGMCMHRSAALVFDVPAAVLMFGTFRPQEPEERKHFANESAVPFIHCWVEYKGVVFAPTTIEAAGMRLIPMDREGYLRANGARDLHSLSRPALLKLDRQYGLKRVLRTGERCKCGASFGAILLDAAGVPWTLSEDGGVVPS